MTSSRVRPTRCQAGAHELPEAKFRRDAGRIQATRLRARLLHWLRSFCAEHGFLEVQTPLLHAAPENANVHQYRLDSVGGRPLWLRTDPEEYLKRYLTAGFASVYEISLNVRAEMPNQDRLHEFTSLECYRSSTTLHHAIEWCHELVTGALLELRGSLSTSLHGTRVQWKTEPVTRTFHDLLAEHAGVAIDEYPTAESLAEYVRSRGWWLGAGDAREKLRGTWLEWLLEHRVLPVLPEPTYVLNFPSELGLSARPSPGDPRVSLRAELYFPGGWELAHLYENLTEPEALRARLLERRSRRLANGYPDVDLDEGLLASASLGMPPMAGFALGVDRLLMLLLGRGRIGEGLLFGFEGFEEQDS